jgi:lysophospholipase L1-like esterase
MAADRRRIVGRLCLISAAAAGGVVLLLQACFGPAVPPPAGPPVERSRLSSAEGLDRFFAALDARQPGRPVRILQIGDSHTANDAFSGRMRQRLQTRFGNAGRGWLPAGIPFKYYRPAQVAVTESGWEHLKPGGPADLPLGLDTIAARSQPPEAVMTIEVAEPASFDRFRVEYVARPDGPPFTAAVDGGTPVRVTTASAAVRVERFEQTLDRPARRAELRVEGRAPVVLLGWGTERRAAGIIYENHGTIGATVDLLGKMAPDTVASELAERRPALLVVAFGTNEGFDDSLDAARYRGRFAARVEELRRAAQGVPVLIIGPPDGNRVARDCQPASCGTAGGDCAWHAPANLAAVREAQRSVAGERGWAYWDWFGAMGGQCGIDRMASADPPLAARDHVHLTKAGYEAMADSLFADLMRAYETWKAQPRTS